MKSRSDVIGGIVLLVIGVGAAIGAVRLHVGTPTEPQPGFFPFLGGVSLAGLSLIILAKGFFGRGEEKVVFGEIRRPAQLLAVLVVLVAVLDWIGYVVGTFLASVLILRVLKVKSWKVLIFTSVCLSAGTYTLFHRLLGVELPMGILGW